MRKDLPEIFKKNIDKSVTNNKKIYYTSESNTINSDRGVEVINDDTLTSVEEKIRKLFKSSRYIFNINVIIRTDKRDYDTKIAGKVKNSIVTINNEVIPIVEINDIIIKDRI